MSTLLPVFAINLFCRSYCTTVHHGLLVSRLRRFRGLAFDRTLRGIYSFVEVEQLGGLGQLVCLQAFPQNLRRPIESD